MVKNKTLASLKLPEALALSIEYSLRKNLFELRRSLSQKDSTMEINTPWNNSVHKTDLKTFIQDVEDFLGLKREVHKNE